LRKPSIDIIFNCLSLKIILNEGGKNFSCVLRSSKSSLESSLQIAEFLLAGQQGRSRVGRGEREKREVKEVAGGAEKAA